MVKERFIELIDKYLAGGATSLEQQLVEEYLKKLEVNDNTIIDNELDLELKEGMWKEIQLQAFQPSAPVVSMTWYKRKVVRSIAVAASVIVLIGLGFSLFIKPKQQPEVVKYTDPKRSSTLTFLHHEINTTGKDKTIRVSDGSLIILTDKSEISYYQPFTTSRDITLIGKANFQVAKDKTKPFTVISSALTTTALGTNFSVTAFKNDKNITVRLNEGSVVVKPIDKNNKKMKKDVFLLPGQELIYGGPSVVVRRFGLNKNASSGQTVHEKITPENPSVPGDTKNPYFMFNNRPLNEVFEQLSEIYNVRIIYEKKDVKNLYFIGKYNSATSVETILKRIATLNNLKVNKLDSAYTITK